MPESTPHVIVLFGATGDLARRKLLPGLLHLSRTGLLPEFEVVGTSLETIDDEGFRELTRAACEKFGRRHVEIAAVDDFAERLTYVSQAAGAARLDQAVASGGWSRSGRGRGLDSPRHPN